MYTGDSSNIRQSLAHLVQYVLLPHRVDEIAIYQLQFYVICLNDMKLPFTQLLISLCYVGITMAEEIQSSGLGISL